MPKSYIRKISNSPASRFLNLETGLEPQRTLHSSLIVGDINHQLLSLLATDFYKPRSLGDVFSALFETENYHPQTSAQQVLTVVEQLRSWFQENEIPLDVLIEKNRYSIIAHRGYAFQMSRQMAAQA